MKKFYFVLAAAAMMLAACNGNKQQAAENAEAQTEDSFEEQQIKAGMSVQLDSLTQCWLRVKPIPMFDKSQEGRIALTAEEKKVKPDYLINPDEIMPTLEGLGLKYRALVVMDIDKGIADLYEMNDVYGAPLQKLVAEVNDPAVKYMIDNEGKVYYQEMIAEIYRLAEENGRANYFWQAAATSIIEQLYILSNNQEKFLVSFTDDDASNLTYHLTLLIEAYAELADYNLELRHLYNVLLPLQDLDAISVDQLRTNLTNMKEQITQARATLFL